MNEPSVFAPARVLSIRMHGRTIYALAIALSLVCSARADETSYTVVIAAPHRALVAAPDLLIALCGPQTEGCTQITGTSFSAECTRQVDTWRMTPFVSLIPNIYIGLSSRREHTLIHELTHIDDVERSVEEYVRRIAAARFASLEQCRAVADLERSRIEDVTRSFVRASFELRR